MPVICDDDMLEKISNGKGAVSSRTFEQLEKLNFGSKFDKNFQDEKVMTFAELLVLCKNDVIIDLNLDHLDYDKYFGTNSEYIKIMFSLVEKFNMTDSIIFEANSKILSKLQAVKKNITVAVILQDKAELDKVKDSFKDCKRVIYSFGINVDEATVKQAISLGKK